MDLTEKALKKEYLYRGKVVTLRVDQALLPNGKTATREIVEHNGGVCVLPLTEQHEILMVEQFRYPYGKVVLEIPAGKRNSLSEKPLDCGIRELQEETGATAEQFDFLGELYPSPGYCGEIIYMYLARNLHFGQTNPDEDEFLNLKKIPLRQAVEMVINGEIKDAKTQTAILKTYYLLKESQA